jgi:hypothetical protein
MRTTINVMTVKPPSEVAEEALEVAEPGVGGMTVTVTVTRAEIHTKGDEVDLEVLPVDMVVGGTCGRIVLLGGQPLHPQVQRSRETLQIRILVTQKGTSLDEILGPNHPKATLSQCPTANRRNNQYLLLSMIQFQTLRLH